jgi:hypothetical protein
VVLIVRTNTSYYRTIDSLSKLATMPPHTPHIS